MLYDDGEVELCMVGLGSWGLVFLFSFFGLRTSLASEGVMCLRGMISMGGDVVDCVAVEGQISATVGFWVRGSLIMLF